MGCTVAWVSRYYSEIIVFNVLQTLISYLHELKGVFFSSYLDMGIIQTSDEVL